MDTKPPEKPIRDTPVTTKPVLPPDAPHGAVYQLEGGIFVDEDGAEVPKPVDRRKKDATPEPPPIPPQHDPANDAIPDPGH